MRPQVFLNCATSLDGKLAGPDGRQVRYSCDVDMVRVHKLRAACDAILVGSGTVLADDPHLTVKSVYAQGKNPIRVVLDRRGRVESGLVLSDDAETLVYHDPSALVTHGKGVPIVDLEDILSDLWSKGVRTLMVEGGAEVLRAFLEAGLWDHFTLYQATTMQGEGVDLWNGEPFGLRGKPEPFGAGVLWRFSP